MKKLSIKKIIVSFAIMLVLFGFLSLVNQSHASTTKQVTSNWGKMNTNIIKYNIDKNNKTAFHIWEKAIKAFKNNGTLKFKATSYKKANLFLKSYNAKDGLASNFQHRDWLKYSKGNRSITIFTGARAFLNMEELRINKTTSIGYVRYAMRELGESLGLNSSKNKKSIMSGHSIKLSAADKAGLKQAYK